MESAFAIQIRFCPLTLAFIVMMAPSLAAAGNIPKRDLPIHGPFQVTASELTAAHVGGIVSPDDHQDSVGGTPSVMPNLPPGEPTGFQTPVATKSFVDIAGLSGVDPGIAVSKRFVMICDNATGVAVYDKAGNLLGPKPGQAAFPNAFTLSSLFTKVKNDIDPGLNYPSGLPPGYSVANGNGIQEYGDCRVMYDHYRNKFWIYAMAKNRPPWDPDTIVKYPAVKLVRRNKAAVAVSKTDDPRDGFYTYWWNETIHNGESNDPAGGNDPVFKSSGSGSDYPSIAVSRDYFVATAGVDRRDPQFKTDTLCEAEDWENCNTTFVQDGQTFHTCGPFYVHVMVVDADALNQGNLHLNPLRPLGRSFGIFVDAKNFITDRTESGDFASGDGRGVKPVMRHGAQVINGASADAFLANNFIYRSGKEPQSFLVLWSLVGDELIPTRYPIHPTTFDSTSDWKFVMNASFRDGKLYAAFQEYWPPRKEEHLWSIRVLRVNTVSSKTELDRTFGVRGLADDPGETFHYKYPGIAANKNGDIAVVYTRFNSDASKQRQEVRFSVWYHNEPDIRPSRLLRAGEPAPAFNTDTGGIAVGPGGDAIWFAHLFAAGKDGKDSHGNTIAVRRIAFGEVFGASQSHASNRK